MSHLDAACSANVIASWCGVRDASALTREALHGECEVPGGVADLFVLFGGAILGSADALAAAMHAGVARHYAIVGGRGHATYWLDRSIERELARWEQLPEPCLVPGESSEAEMLAAVLYHRYGLVPDFLETASTNCGNNITFLLNMLEEQGYVPKSVILSQDAAMQRRMDATWRRQVADRPAFANVQAVNWAFHRARITGHNGSLSYSHAPEGMWELGDYLRLLAGEVMRLTDDENGYGPCGRDFVVHVDVPDDVTRAYEALLDALGSDVRLPDERYA